LSRFNACVIVEFLQICNTDQRVVYNKIQERRLLLEIPIGSRSKVVEK
jgi:hypothetical protein